MANYPTPSQGGPPYLKYLKKQKDWKKITLVSTYEDGGIDTNESASNALQEYEILYDGLTDTQAKALDDFWNTHRLSVNFDFIEPRDYPWTGAAGSTVTACRFISYEGDHGKANKTQKRTVVIGKFPA